MSATQHISKSRKNVIGKERIKEREKNVTEREGGRYRGSEERDGGEGGREGMEEEEGIETLNKNKAVDPRSSPDRPESDPRSTWWAP